MCPLTQSDIIPPSVRRASRKESRAGEEANIRIQEYGVTAGELCSLMQLRGPSLKEKIDDDYGGVTGLCIQICTSSTEGLADTPREMQKRIQHFGPNVIPMKKSKSFFRLMLGALKEPTLIILEVATVVSLALSFWNMFRPGAETGGGSLEWIEGVAIAVGVLVIVLVTAFNDYGKERQFRLLQERVRDEHKISVWRNGKTAMIPVQELVVGDVCQVKYGDVIPADGIVLHSQELTIDESSLTGESDPVKKNSENDCQVLSGTHVVEGSGRILMLAVGLNSQTGAIYKLLGAVRKEKQQKKVKEPFSEEKTNGHIVQDESANGSVNIAMEDPNAVKQASDAERKEKNHSVFQSKLNVLAYRIGIIGFIFSAATSLVIIIRFCVENYGIQKRPWKTEDATTIMDSIVVGITILVSAIPEGLPLAVTLTLAFSAKKMMRDNNLVRHLFACETMGCATTICSDKTGTLTTNRMTVTKSWLGGSVHGPVPNPSQIVPSIADIISTAVAVNSSYTSDIVISEGNSLPEHRGNKTECALLGYTAALGRSYRDIRAKFREDSFVKVYTFNSSRKSMSTVVAIPGGWRVFTKGAAEIVLAKCGCLLDETGSLFALEPELIASLSTGVVSAMASEGLRTICIAYKDFILNTANPGYSYPVNVVKVPSKPDFEDERTIISGLTCLALVGIEDPVRPEVPKAIRRCQRAGITVRMITGDNVETARSIAQKCGITKPDDDSLVLEGKQFNTLIRDENGQIDKVRFDKIWPKLRVLARSTPEDKFTLVDGIINSRASKHREVVAVTGDGTNDGPALRKADVGFAMGIAGTDVAKEASDIILTDDNFISIVKACMWGRNIYDNVAKFLQFQLTVNVAALSVAIISACVIGSCMNWTVDNVVDEPDRPCLRHRTCATWTCAHVEDTPLKAVPMLWINMIQDTLGSLALATEPPGEALLKRKPYGRKKRIISSIITRNILGQGIYQAVVLLCILFVGPRYFGIFEQRQVGHVVGEPTFLYTMIFNTLVVMTSFNLINARCIHNEVNVFEGIHRNIYFVILWLIMFVTQILVVQFGGYVFATQPLPLDAWMVCLFFGVGSLLWYHILRLVPTRRKMTLGDWLE